MGTRGPSVKKHVTPIYFMYTAGTDGQPLIHTTGPGGTTKGSGKPGDAQNAAIVPSGVTGDFAGILWSTVTDVDESRFPHLAKWHGRNTTFCRPINVIDHGSIFTDQVEAADTPTAHAAAHWSANGLFTTTTTSNQVGVFTGTKDSDGYVGIDLDKT